jgi:hypothetical protein
MGLAKVLKARFGRDPSEAELAAARAERARLKAAEASEAPSEPAPAPPAKRAKSAGGPSAADLVTPAKSKGSSSRLEDIDDDEEVIVEEDPAESAAVWPAEPGDVALLQVIQNAVTCFAMNSLALRALYPGGEATDDELNAIAPAREDSSPTGSKRRGKKSRGKQKPTAKRAATGYILFCSEQAQRRKSEDAPGQKRERGAAMTENGALWSNLSEAEKKVWNDRAEAKKATTVG